jgi:hypothetical protein
LTNNNSNYWNEYNANYQAEQDRIANENAAAQLRLQQDQFDWQKAQVGNGVVTGKDLESGLPSGVIDKVSAMENDIVRSNYLADQVAKGYMTQDQMNYILAQTLANDTVEYKGQRFYVVDNGGVNGFLGLGKWFGNIVNNAKVMAEDGNIYSMADLANGKYGDAAWTKADVVALQKKLGVH